MTTLSIQPPFPIFSDRDGSPLENGYIWVGTANLNPITNPVAVYWDAGLTQPAALPVRTINGYPANNGTPGRLYVASDFSITVQDAKGSLVYSALNENALSADGVLFIQAGAGAVTRTVQNKLRDIINARDFGAVADGVTNNTASVQSAINSIGVYGGTVYIPDGAKFNLRSLTFPERFNLDYRVDDDLSQSQLPASQLASSERVLFSSNSSYPDQPTGGIVNEWRLTAPFHPGLVVDVRKDLASNIAPYLGPGQSAVDPVRASWNILDEQTGAFRVVYENYLTPTTFSGVFMHGWKNIVRLNGIGTAQWTSAPAAGVLVTGVTSGAKGFVLTVAAGYTDLLWFSGRFVAGERVSDNNETTAATITSAVFSEFANAWISQDLKTGAWTIGDRPPGAGTETVNISGNAKVVPTRGGVANVPKSVSNPGYFWGDDPEIPTFNQIGIIYPATGTAGLRRLQMVRQNSPTSVGAVVPVSVMVNVNDALLISDQAVNVASITKTGTGEYQVNFINNLASAFPIYTLSLDGFYMPDWWAGVTFQAVGSVTVRVRNPAGVATDLPAGAQVGLVGMGGDVI
jgi:hypothetical protein